MFTGIIRHIGTVRQVAPAAGGKKLTIDIGPLADGLTPGESVAVMGTCLTVSQIAGSQAAFDVITETLSKTTLGSLVADSKVNLERPLKLSDFLDGHLVQGHVDGIAKVKTIRTGQEHVIEFSAETSLTGQMVPKGSICIDGVSLTLVAVGRGSFSVALIPTTLEDTTLANLKAGSQVNVETDLIGKYLQKYLTGLTSSGRSGGGVTLEKLKDAGFI